MVAVTLDGRGRAAAGAPVYDGRVLRALVAISLVVAAARPAAADEGALGPVAILPFVGDGRMAMYGQPVAAALAKVGRAAGLDIVLLPVGGEVPAGAHLVIDGRLVRSGAKVVLEARVRDPERGLDVARRSATAPTLAVVDRAADELGAALVPLVSDGLAAQAAARLQARAALAAATPPVAPPTDVAPTGEVAPPPVDDARPLALLALTGAVTGADGQGISPLVAPSLVRLAGRLGHRAAPLGEGGLATPAQAVIAADAELAIVIRVLAVDGSVARGIPVARARAQVDVYDRTGLRYRRTVRTDTLVGSRGDRADTLVRSAVAQIVDVVAPRLREQLGPGAR